MRIIAERQGTMTSEEMERTMQFILEQQAQTSVKLDQIVDRQDRTDENLARLTAKVESLTEDVRTLKEVSETHSQSLDVLIGIVQKLGEGQQWLLESQRRTDERLDTFIVAMERYISQGRDGKSQE